MSGHTGFELPLENYRDDILEAAEKSERIFRVLDVGCGNFEYRNTLESFLNSIYAEASRDIDTEFYGLDRDLEALENADLDDSHVFEAGDEFPYEDDSFDLVISNHFYCQIDSENVGVVEDETDRVLKPTGLSIHGPHNIRSRK